MSTPSMAEVLHKHHCGCDHPDDGCWMGGYDHGGAQALAAAGFGHVASVEAERAVSFTAEVLRDRARQAAARTVAAEAERDKALRKFERCLESENRAQAALADAEAQVANLQRWKDEALPVMDGLQELGRALGLPLGERITGERALEAVQVLVAQLAAVRSLCADARRSAGGPFVAKVDVLSIERALDGESAR